MPVKDNTIDKDLDDVKENLKAELKKELEAELRNKLEAEQKKKDADLREKIKLELEEERIAAALAEAEEKKKIQDEKKRKHEAKISKLPWSPELRSVVTAMVHPGFNNEKDAHIRTFETEQEANSLRRDLEGLDSKNQQSLLHPSNYAWYGIERRLIDGKMCIAKTSQPFTYRIQKFMEEQAKLEQADSSNVGQMEQKIKSLQEQLNQVLHLSNVNNADHSAQLGLEESQAEILRNDIEESNRMNEDDYDLTSASSRALG